MSVSLAGPAFVLPPELEAREPAEARGLARDDVRLLVTSADAGDSVETFRALPRFLREGDLLVVNDSATLPAAVDARTASGSEIVLHFSTHVAGTLWIVEPRAAFEAPERLDLPAGAVATLIAPAGPASIRLWFARIETSEAVVNISTLRGGPFVIRTSRGAFRSSRIRRSSRAFRVRPRCRRPAGPSRRACSNCLRAVE